MNTANAFKSCRRLTGNFNTTNKFDGITGNVIKDFFDSGNGIMIGQGDCPDAGVFGQS